MEYDKVIVGEHLRTIRKKKGYDIFAASSIMQISDTQLKKIECGSRGMSVSLCYRIMDAYGIDANQLLNVTANDAKGKDSIDKMLEGLNDRQREYFTDIFKEMIQSFLERKVG